MKRLLLITIILLSCQSFAQKRCIDYVDPSIGSSGWGNCTPGPARPFGLVKPGINCGWDTGSGWRAQPHPVSGFAQVHMCGAGGGPKYGNIMIQPFIGELDATYHEFHRAEEIYLPGYGSVTYEENAVKTEFAASESSVFYAITYPEGTKKSLSLDAAFHLGHSNDIDSDESQFLVGSEVEFVSDTEIRGYSRVRGGWNRGAAYTVFFALVSDTPFSEVRTWKDSLITSEKNQYDEGKETGALLSFAGHEKTVNIKIGISYLSSLKARKNMESQMPDWSLQQYVDKTKDAWEPLLSRIEIDPSTPECQKRMFYTGLYHTMMHPTDKTGECPLWNDDVPYYDDYFALWDTYRTSYPMFNLLYPELSSRMIQSMLMIFKRQNYVPDGRSGHWNGRTQGGSNSNIVFTDAYLKGVKDVDWEMCLKSDLKDADVPPGDIEEQHGRGGLIEYNSLGYVPYGKPRSCSRTVDYSICDHAISTLARALGHDDIADRFLRQSSNWKNLWRDMESEGVRGFVLPRNPDGRWLEQIESHDPGIAPLKVTPSLGFWEEYHFGQAWWGTCYYEGNAWQYSLAIPHDVPGLVEICGGDEAFDKRLDIFFENGHFDVSNEPSFIIPCLYHWIGKPWKTSDCIRKYVLSQFDDTLTGIPGNDDTGAMSSWLDFHMLGLYPIAGQDIYLIYTPVLKSSVLHLPGGDFSVKAEKLTEKNVYIQQAFLNGKPYEYSALRHADLAAGGELVLKMGPKPSQWGKQILPQ